MLCNSRTDFARNAKGLVILSAIIFFVPMVCAQTQTTQTEQLVKVGVIVTDRGRSVEGVRKEDLLVIEDGAAQVISYFSKDERPITCGLVIDASGSVRRILMGLIDSAKTVVGGLNSRDEGFVARFVGRDNFKIKQEITSDREAIEDTLDDIYVEGGQTALLDAVDNSLKYLDDKRPADVNSRRRILILVTDGEDRGSRLNDSKAMLARLRQSDVQVFVIGLTKFSSLQSSAGKATDLLNAMAEQTGGRAFFPDSDSGLPDIAAQIARDMHMQYLIGYSSAGRSPATEHRVQVKWVGTEQVKRKVIVRPSISNK
jgi:Ca-activated chloride channel family protein